MILISKQSAGLQTELGMMEGIIGFVHNASLVNERSIAGLRKSLVNEFDSIYCFNLRGNQRTKGELSKKEGGKVFGGSSRTPVAITFLIKNPEKRKEQAKIKYHEVEDYLNREEKLEKIKNFKCIKGIEEKKEWKVIVPDKYGDWINQRDDSFYQFMSIGDKKSGNQNTIFSLYGQGIKTHRDSWVYNFDKNRVKQNMKNMIEFYNQELVLLKNKNLNIKNIDQFIDLDPKKITWSYGVKENLLKKKQAFFKKEYIKQSIYRPFMKSWVYFDKMFNERQYQLPKIFPKNNTGNKVICVSGVGAKTFSVLMTDFIPDVGFTPSGQCFPLYRFDELQESDQKSLIEESSPSYSITDSTLNLFKLHYKSLSEQNKTSTSNNIVQTTPESITKEDIFYYIYGLLHSEDYRKRYKSNLDKDLPRIPLVPEFWEFVNIGRKLADLHLNYESQSPPERIKILNKGKEVNLQKFAPENLKVKKMKVDKKDKTKIQFNDYITISNIPEEAWNYKINGWSAPKWIVERYQYKKDKKTDLINDPNTYSEDPAYILKLLLSVITVSLKTQELVQSLPSIDFDSLIASIDKTG